MSESHPAFAELNEYVADIAEWIASSAAAVLVMTGGRVANEWYAGVYQPRTNGRAVDAESQFNVASVRKSYLGLAVSLALHEGKIRSLDDPITEYLDGGNAEILRKTTIRHLLTHTHGLHNRNQRKFAAGTNWSYGNTGVNLLIEMVRQWFGRPLAQVMDEKVFSPCGCKETGWRKTGNEKLVWLGEAYDGEDGSEANLFVSARELAGWGHLHLTQGVIGGKRILPAEVFRQAVSVATPAGLAPDLPRNGFFWFVQENPHPKSEIGGSVPKGSYQILGITGCACLVMPALQTVAVRMYSQKGPGPLDYDYLRDIQTFGNLVCESIYQLIQ